MHRDGRQPIALGHLTDSGDLKSLVSGLQMAGVTILGVIPSEPSLDHQDSSTYHRNVLFLLTIHPDVRLDVKGR